MCDRNLFKTRRFEFFVCCGDSVDGASAWQKQGESEPRRNPGSNSPSTSQVEPPIRSSASKQSNKSRECAKQKAHSRSANALLQLQPTHVMLSRDGDQAVSRLRMQGAGEGVYLLSVQPNLLKPGAADRRGVDPIGIDRPRRKAAEDTAVGSFVLWETGGWSGRTAGRS